MEKVVLIMAGGSGTRFWPLSTTEKPKQFLDLISDKTMIRETIAVANVVVKTFFLLMFSFFSSSIIDSKSAFSSAFRLEIKV